MFEIVEHDTYLHVKHTFYVKIKISSLHPMKFVHFFNFSSSPKKQRLSAVRQEETKIQLCYMIP